MDNFFDESELRQDEFDMERITYFISLSAEEKLIHLERLNALLQTLMPKKNQKIWERLKHEGF